MPLWWPAYSPDGRYALMPRIDEQPIGIGSPPPQPLDAVVFDPETFKPLERLPISASVLAWAS